MNPYRIFIKYGLIAFGFIAFFVGVYFDGYVRGEKTVQNKWDLTNAKQAILIAKDADLSLKTLEDAQNIAFNSTKSYEGKINVLKDYYNTHAITLPSRVCKPAASSSNVARVEVPTTTERINDSPKNNLFIAKIDFEKLPLECAETTQQLISLQDWLADTIIVFNRE